MDQAERRLFLIRYLMDENLEYRALTIPSHEPGQKKLLRSLMNLRPPKPISDEFLQVESSYLAEEQKKRTIVSLADLSPVREHIYLWRGDITLLQVDGIVNAANSDLLGCFMPCHNCIDNAIHTAAGVELRLACHEMMEEQGHREPTGVAKITPGFHLPCSYILHTVGPIIYSGGNLTYQDCELLASCYRSCLELANQHGLKSLAFCCISTGEFRFPSENAADIAVRTVLDFQKQHAARIEVIFDVYKEEDYQIYRRILSGGLPATGE